VIRGRGDRLERIDDDPAHDLPDDLEEVQFGTRRRDLDDQIIAAAGDGHRGAGQDRVES